MSLTAGYFTRPSRMSVCLDRSLPTRWSLNAFSQLEHFCRVAVAQLQGYYVTHGNAMLTTCRGALATKFPA